MNDEWLSKLRIRGDYRSSSGSLKSRCHAIIRFARKILEGCHLECAPPSDLREHARLRARVRSDDPLRTVNCEFPLMNIFPGVSITERNIVSVGHSKQSARSVTASPLGDPVEQRLGRHGINQRRVVTIDNVGDRQYRKAFRGDLETEYLDVRVGYRHPDALVTAKIRLDTWRTRSTASETWSEGNSEARWVWSSPASSSPASVRSVLTNIFCTCSSSTTHGSRRESMVVGWSPGRHATPSAAT